MALTPTEEAGLRIILGSYVEAGYTTPEQVTEMLTLTRLEQELRALESDETNLRATFAIATSDFNDELAAIQAAQAAKRAEIDAL